MRPKYELKLSNFSNQNWTKLRAHVLVDFGQISVMKLDYYFGSVNEALAIYSIETSFNGTSYR